MSPQEVMKAIHDDAWAALKVTSMHVDGIELMLRDEEACNLIDTGMLYSTGATLSYLRQRGWLNEEKMHAEMESE
jgi:hypothetical protein